VPRPASVRPLDKPHLRRLPPSLAPRRAPLVRAVRATRAVIWTVSDLPRLAGGAPAGQIGGLAGCGSPPHRPRAQIRGPAADRGRPRHRDGARAAPGDRRRHAGTDPTLKAAAACPGIQSKRATGVEPRPAMGVSGPGTAGPDPGYRNPDGVDTGRAPSECGGGVFNAERGMWSAEWVFPRAFRTPRSEFHVSTCR
jgi:hypothetical protein